MAKRESKTHQLLCKRCYAVPPGWHEGPLMKNKWAAYRKRSYALAASIHPEKVMRGTLVFIPDPPRKAKKARKSNGK